MGVISSDNTRPLSYKINETKGRSNLSSLLATRILATSICSLQEFQMFKSDTAPFIVSDRSI